jgi:Ca-activated chloride channel family protein
MFEDFHFLQPEWFLALIPLGLLLWLVRKPGTADSAWRKVCDIHLLPWLLVHPGKAAARLPQYLLASGWLVAVVALADPVWEKQPQPAFRIQDARVIVLDLSRSMVTPDLKPSRLARARYKVADVLKRSEEGQTGLVAFAGDAFVVSPLTRDTDTIASLLNALDPNLMPVQGSRADLGLLKAGELMQQAGIPRGEILLIADGFDGARTLESAADLRDQGYSVSVLAVGTKAGAPLPNGQGGYLHDAAGNIVVPSLDTDALRALAAAGGGRYASISGNDTDLDVLLTDRVPRPGTRMEDTGLKTDVWQSRGPWLVLLLLPLAALAFRRGWLLSAVVLVSSTLTAPEPAMASAWDNLWLRRDQQAEQALQAGELEQATELAQDPLRRGTAEYRSGNYEQALQSFSNARGTDAAYNRGNALAQLGRYEDAIAAYDAALASQPGMQDATHNKALVEERLRQQSAQDASNAGQQESADSKSSSEPFAENAQGGANSQDESQAQSTDGGDAQDQASDQQTADTTPDGQQEDAQTSEQTSEAGTGSEQPQEQQAGQGGSTPQDGMQPPPADADNAFAQAGQEGNEDERTAESRELPEPMPAADAAEGQPPPGVQASADSLTTEEQQAAEQWLRRIPDDPGGLLRRKFLYQYQQRAARAGNTNEPAW